VIESALVDAATVPVDRGGAATVVSMVVAMVTAWRGTWTVAPPGICTGRSEADAEQSCKTDSGCQC
jgi:hypothetical protein